MDIVRANNNEGGNNNVVFREYRKGNWTIQETMVLIEAKKMDEERRMKRHGESSSSGGIERGGKPAELRWKWVEDYCWRKGCLRSQTQCNDKWDNLMRDFKKVREYEKKMGGEKDDRRSYWKLEKSERKERNLPSNMLNQLYDALVEAVEKKGRQRVAMAGGVSGGGVGSSSGVVVDDGCRQSMLPFAVQHHVPLPPPPPPLFLPLPPPLPLPPATTPPPPQSALPLPQRLPTVDSDTSHEHSDSPSKRRRRGRGGGEGTSTAAAAHGSGGGAGRNNSPNEEGVEGNAISRGATIIAEAIQASEERVERRHREVMSMHQRRLQIEENKAENNRHGINGLVDAVNKLANSILALAARDNNNNNNNNNNNQTP